MNKKNMEEFTQKVEDNANEILEDTLLDKEASLENTRGFSYDDIVKISTHDKMSKLPWLTAIFLIIIISVVLGYMFFKNNPQTIFTMAIDNFFSSINDSFNDNSYDISKGKVNIKVDIDSSEDKELFDEISKLDINMDYSMDSANGLSFFKVNSKYENEEFLNFNIYNDKKSFYIYPKGIYDGYIKLNSDTSFTGVSLSDFKVLLNGLNQAFDKVATSEKISGSKFNYDLGNKSIKVYRSMLVIDKNNYDRVSETFINSLKTNSEFVSSLARMRSVSTSDVKKSLDNYILKLEGFFKDNEKFEVILYTDRRTNDFIKGEMSGKLGSFIYKLEDGEFSLVDNKEKISYSGNVSMDVNKKKTKYDFKFNFKKSLNGSVVSSGIVNVNMTNNKAESFGKVKLDKTINQEDLSDIDKFSIYTKLFTMPNVSKFLK